jgi:hypothetical protein
MEDHSNRPEPEDPRVRRAGERTLLTWVRTGLALMGFGFVVARFGLFLHEVAATAASARTSPPPRPPRRHRSERRCSSKPWPSFARSPSCRGMLMGHIPELRCEFAHGARPVEGGFPEGRACELHYAPARPGRLRARYCHRLTCWPSFHPSLEDKGPGPVLSLVPLACGHFTRTTVGRAASGSRAAERYRTVSPNPHAPRNGREGLPARSP